MFNNFTFIIFYYNNSFLLTNYTSTPVKYKVFKMLSYIFVDLVHHRLPQQCSLIHNDQHHHEWTPIPHHVLYLFSFLPFLLNVQYPLINESRNIIKNYYLLL